MASFVAGMVTGAAAILAPTVGVEIYEYVSSKTKQFIKKTSKNTHNNCTLLDKYLKEKVSYCTNFFKILSRTLSKHKNQQKITKVVKQIYDKLMFMDKTLLLIEEALYKIKVDVRKKYLQILYEMIRNNNGQLLRHKELYYTMICDDLRVNGMLDIIHDLVKSTVIDIGKIYSNVLNEKIKLS